MEAQPDAPYAYRIRLAYDQVVTLFGQAEAEFDSFLRQSQISQAEADKFFIELFRTQKWKRTGVIWWNLLDGCPQISDAVVDYYFIKKLAFSYIQRAQQPVCLMMEETADALRLIGVNDLAETCEVDYAVYAVSGDALLPVIAGGRAQITTDEAQTLEVLSPPAERTFYLMEWTVDGQPHRNHYVYGMKGMPYAWYMAALRRCGMDAFEGFPPEET